jgi:hypothetical protein
MNDQADTGSKNGFVAQVIGNTFLQAAILIYTDWSYLNAEFSYFHLSVIALNVSHLDYILHGTLLFTPNIIFAVVLRHSRRAGPCGPMSETESCSDVLFLAL